MPKRTLADLDELDESENLEKDTVATVQHDVGQTRSPSLDLRTRSHKKRPKLLEDVGSDMEEDEIEEIKPGVQLDQPPHVPPITPSYQNSLATAHHMTDNVQATRKLSSILDTTLVVPLVVPFKELCETIKANIVPKSYEFKEDSTESALKKIPDGDEIKIRNDGNNAVCTFTGTKGMEESTKVLLDAFIASGQTALTIGGSDPQMVLILAKLVAEGKAKPDSKLTVTISPDARVILAGQLALIAELEKIQPAVVSAPSRLAP